MKYITILCNLSGNIAVSEGRTYFLFEKVSWSSKGFALLQKDWGGSYHLIDFRSLHLLEVSSDFIAN